MVNYTLHLTTALNFSLELIDNKAPLTYPLLSDTLMYI